MPMSLPGCMFQPGSLKVGSTWQLTHPAEVKTAFPATGSPSAVDSGAVSVSWYDRRNDAANNLQTDVYKAFSSDGGATFGAIQRVTDQSFGIPQLNPNFDPNIAQCYMGEYIAAVGDAHNFYYAWGDNRNTVTSAAWPVEQASAERQPSIAAMRSSNTATVGLEMRE